MRHDRCDIHQQSAYYHCNNCFVCKLFGSFFNKSGQINITPQQYHTQNIVEQFTNRGYNIMYGNLTNIYITIIIEPPKMKIK